MLLRLPIAFIGSALLSLGMFWLMHHLISQPIDAGEVREAMRIEFSRLRQDTEVATKRDEKVTRERPPQAPEQLRMSFNTSGVENNVAQLTPVVDAAGAMSKMSMSAGSDRDVIPLVRIPPDYPPRALSRGLEGYVVVQFTITGAGTVKDAIAIESSSKIFEDAAIKSILRWRYNPKVENGAAVERIGMRTVIRFQLEN
ncbi:MAG: TonB family protein [Gammaproteobacteria bacterium]|nr:TonB family protein [Gammaproteobacteria bacterium]